MKGERTVNKLLFLGVVLVAACSRNEVAKGPNDAEHRNASPREASEEGRPILRATLTQAGSASTAYPQAKSLTLFAGPDGSTPKTFSLVEDNGLRCNRAPCPSESTTRFAITEVGPSTDLNGAQFYKYSATELFQNIPPNVRMAARHLEVAEDSGLHMAWSVTISNPLPAEGTKQYIGYPTQVKDLEGVNCNREVTLAALQTDGRHVSNPSCRVSIHANPVEVAPGGVGEVDVSCEQSFDRGSVRLWVTSRYSFHLASGGHCRVESIAPIHAPPAALTGR